MKKILPILLAIFLLSCVPERITPQPIAPVAPITPKESWQKVWDDTLTQAKKELKVVIRSEMPQEVNRALTVAFQEKTGIAAEFEPGARGGAMHQKIITERKAGLYLVDLLFGSGIAIYAIAKPAGFLEPFEKYLFLPEVVDPKLWYGSQFPWFDQDRTISYLTLAPSTPLTVNTSLMKPEEIKSYRDLLKPQYKQRILFLDPSIPGQGNNWFSVYAREEMLGLEFMKALAKQEPIVVRDTRIQTEWLSKGKYPVSLGAGWALFAPFLDAGSPIANVTVEEPDYLTAATAYLVVIKDTPHPAATKLFLNWVMSKEGSMVIQKLYERQSPRIDTGMEGLSRTRAFRAEGVKYYNSAREEHEKEKILTLEPKIQEIFGPLIK